MGERSEGARAGTIVIFNEDEDACEEMIAYVWDAYDNHGRGISPKMARLMANMYYVGGIAHLLGIDEGALSAVDNNSR